MQLSAAELAVLAAVDGVGKVTVRRLLQALTKHEVSFGNFGTNCRPHLQKLHFQINRYIALKVLKKNILLAHTDNTYLHNKYSR